MLPAFAFLCLPAKTKKKTPVNSVSTQNQVLTWSLQGLYFSPPGRGAGPGVSLAPGEVSAACVPPAEIPAVPPLLCRGHRNPVGLRGLLNVPGLEVVPGKVCRPEPTIHPSVSSAPFLISWNENMYTRARTPGARGTKRISTKAFIRTNKKLGNACFFSPPLQRRGW